MSELRTAWLEDTVVDRLQRVARDDQSADFLKSLRWTDQDSSFQVTLRNHKNGAVQVLKVHSDERPIPRAVLSDGRVAIHARFSKASLKRHHEKGTSHSAQVIQGQLMLTEFDICVTRYGDSDQRISLLIQAFERTASGTPRTVRTGLITEQAAVRDTFDRLFNMGPRARDRSSLPNGHNGKGTKTHLNVDEESRSQDAESNDNGGSQAMFATQAHPKLSTPSSPDAEILRLGGVNLGPPKEAKRFKAANDVVPRTNEALLAILHKGRAPEALNGQIEPSSEHEHNGPRPTAHESDLTSSQQIDLQQPRSTQPQVSKTNSSYLHDGSFHFTRTLPQHLLGMNEKQAEVLEGNASWRAGHLNVPRETLALLRNTTDTRHLADQSETKFCSSHDKTASPVPDAPEEPEASFGGSSSDGELSGWSQSDQDNARKSRDGLPPDSSAESNHLPKRPKNNKDGASGPATPAKPDQRQRQSTAMRSSPVVEREEQVTQSSGRTYGLFGPRKSTMASPRPLTSPVASGLDGQKSSSEASHSSARKARKRSMREEERKELPADKSTGSSSTSQIPPCATPAAITVTSGSTHNSHTQSSRFAVTIDGGFHESQSPHIDSAQREQHSSTDSSRRSRPQAHQPSSTFTPVSQNGTGPQGQTSHQSIKSVQSNERRPLPDSSSPPAKKPRMMQGPIPEKRIETPTELAKCHRREFVQARRLVQQAQEQAASYQQPSSDVEMFDARESPLASPSKLALRSNAGPSLGQEQLDLRHSQELSAVGTTDSHHPSPPARVSPEQTPGGHHSADSDLYRRFKRCYPAYAGDPKHFTARCRIMDKLHAEGKLHKSLFDDWAVRHWTDYIPYSRRCIEGGEDARSYQEYYNDEFDETQYHGKVLTLEGLRAFLSETEPKPVHLLGPIAGGSIASTHVSSPAPARQSSGLDLAPRLQAQTSSPRIHDQPPRHPQSGKRTSIIADPRHVPSTPSRLEYHNPSYHFSHRSSPRDVSGPRTSARVPSYQVRSTHQPNAQWHSGSAGPRHAPGVTATASPPTIRLLPSEPRAMRVEHQTLSATSSDQVRGARGDFVRKDTDTVLPPRPAPAQALPEQGQSPERASPEVIEVMSDHESMQHIETGLQSEPEASASEDAEGQPSATQQWWKNDTTVFKEHAKAFNSLRIFGGDLTRHGNGRINVLDWQI